MSQIGLSRVKEIYKKKKVKFIVQYNLGDTTLPKGPIGRPMI